MGRREFEVRTTLSAAPEAAIDFLMDISGHGGLHPFLASATVVGSGTSADGPWWEWSVVERPTLGPLRYRLRFRAWLTRTSATSMTALVHAAPGCRLRASTAAHPMHGGGCRLVETTEVLAPWPVLAYMSRNAEAAHRRTFDRLGDVVT